MSGVRFHHRADSSFHMIVVAHMSIIVFNMVLMVNMWCQIVRNKVVNIVVVVDTGASVYTNKL